VTGAEFKTLREGLGLSRAHLASILHVSLRTIERYESTTTSIPWLTAFVVRFSATNPYSSFTATFLKGD